VLSSALASRAPQPGDKNQYSVIAVDPDRFPKVRYREAMDFITFATSPEGQSIIGNYAKHGARLFIPNAVPTAIGMK